MAITTRKGESPGFTLTIPDWTNGTSNINVKGSSPALATTGVSETASISSARGVFVEADASSSDIRVRLNETYSIVLDNSVYLIEQNVMIPY